MKKYAVLVAAVGSFAMLAGCADTPRDNAAARGGLLGAAAGALLGGAATGRAGGALAGAAIGGASGAVIGAASHDSRRYDDGRRCVRVGYDYDGNRICRRYVYN